MDEPGVIFLMGATATGKTDLAVEICDRFDVEIISVDSALIYRDMDIGTAKPDAQTLARAPHHLVDIIDPSQSYSVWDFLQQSRQLVAEISQRGKVPLMVGGTMMYYNAFEQGLNRLPQADEGLRRQLELEAIEQGWPAMHARLGEIDPDTAAKVKNTDSQRIQRALEVYKISGLPLSQLQNQATQGFPGQINKIQLDVDDRAALHRRIEHRFMQMIESGFVEEVAALKRRDDLNLSLPSMRCVGYRQVWQFLQGNFNHGEMIGKAVAATRQLAKRQITWLRKQPRDGAFDCLHYRKDDIFRRIERSFSRF